jgi:hypothetical protein
LDLIVALLSFRPESRFDRDEVEKSGLIDFSTHLRLARNDNRAH